MDLAAVAAPGKKIFGVPVLSVLSIMRITRVYYDGWVTGQGDDKRER